MFELPDRRRIYLLRHAEAAYVAEDGTVTSDPRQVGLTDTGRVQARKQSAVLASVPFDRAICSGLPRTRQTAGIILADREQPGLEAITALEEIQGGNRDQPQGSVTEWLQRVANPWAAADQPEAKFLGGERFVDFAARVTPAFDAIVADPGWRCLLLVLHGAVNRMIFNHVMGLTWQGRMSIEQDNCCINIIDVDTDTSSVGADGSAARYLVRAVNLTAYDLNKSGFWLTTMEQTAARIAETLG